MDQRKNILRAVRFERPESIPMIFHINPACWHHYPQNALQDLMEAHPGLFPDFQRSEGLVEPELLPYARAGAPFTDPGIYVSNVQYALGLNDAAKRLICGDNLRGLLGRVQ